MRRRTGRRNTRADSGHGEGGPGDEQDRKEEHKGWQGTRDRLGVEVKERQGEQDGKEENLRAGRRTRVMQGGRGGEKICLYTYNIAS